MTNGLSNQLRQELQDSATLLTWEPNELTFCYELAGLSLAHIAVGIINSRYDFAKLAARAHTRSDVLWASLTDARILGVEDQAEGSSHVAPVSAPSADWAVEVPSSEFGM